MQDCLPRFATPRTEGRKTHGKRIGIIAAALGTPFMPWQQRVADVIGEVDLETGLLAYREWRLTVPRQSGKTSLILPKFIYRCLGGLGQRQRVVYTAQTRNDARKKFETEHLDLIKRSHIFDGLFTPRLAAGSERILWDITGSIHSIDAVTETAGHGGTIDEAVIDEAFAQPDGRVEQAMVPAMSTRDNAQLGVVSTAGDRKSTYLRGKVMSGRSIAAGQAEGRLACSGIASFEWSAPEDADADDEAVWRACMPALGRTIKPEAVRAARISMADEPGSWERAYLNQWLDDRNPVQIIPDEHWRACADPSAVIDGRLVWSIEVSLDRAWGAIGAAGRATDGREVIELCDYRPDGTQWIVSRLIDMRDRNGRENDIVAVDASGPAGSLIPDLEAAGFTVKRIPLQANAQAATAFYDAACVEPRRLAHRDQTEINTALAAAAKTKTGDSWRWSRGASLTDICPLTVVTFALWGLSVSEDEWYDVLDSIG